MSVLGDNLKKARERLGLTRPDFAEKMGCGDNTVWRWEKGEREPDLETLFKLAEKLNTSIAYLLGETDSTKDITSQFMLVPVVEFEACAGDGNGYAEFEWREINKVPVNKNDLMGYMWQNENMRIIRISGRSMEPKYHDGDHVLFVQGSDYHSNDIVIAVFDGRIYIRGYFPEEGQIRLRPLNPITTDIVIPFEDQRLSIAGKVIAKVPELEVDAGFYS